MNRARWLLLFVMTCVVGQGLVLPEPTLARNRFCRPRARFCQPVPNCCLQPAPICCQQAQPSEETTPALSKTVVSVCPMYPWADWGGGNYSYYAVRCDDFSPVNLNAGTLTCPSNCPSGADCVQVDLKFYKRGKEKGHVPHQVNPLPAKKERNFDQTVPPVKAMPANGDLVARTLKGSALVKFRRISTVPNAFVHVRLDEFSVVGKDHNGDFKAANFFVGNEVRPDAGDLEIPEATVDRISKFAALITHDGEQYLVLMNSAILP